MRALHRTVAARLLALWLVLLAASPVTAPFTLCELSDFLHHHHPTDHSTPSPGRQAAVPLAKVVAPALTVAIAPVTLVTPDVTSDRSVEQPVVAAVQARERLQTVLRL